MEASTEKLCLEEISHSVCDADKKVNITEISNNWNCSYKASEAILLKWLNQYKGEKCIAKEYLIRGVDLNENCVISVVPERKLEALENICPKFTSSLYSIELAGGTAKRLNLFQASESKFINLPLKSDERKCKVSEIIISPAKTIKKELESAASNSKKPINSLFGTAQVKKEKTSPTQKDATAGNVAIKDEPIASKKESPKKKETTPKGAKVALGKSAISSFFSSKPTFGGPQKPATSTETSSHAKVKVEKVEIKENSSQAKVKVEKMEIKEKSTESKSTNNKRTLSVSDDDDAIPGTPQEKPKPSKKKVKMESVKIKKTDKKAPNRSRLMQICDSSSDDECVEVKQEVNVHPTKVKEKENKTPPKNDTEKMDTDDHAENGNVSKKRRIKIKRPVTRTYEDDDGFIKVVHEIEEISCSDDETESIPKPKVSLAANKKSSNTDSEQNNDGAKGKKKISPSNRKKQGSILSFFGKK